MDTKSEVQEVIDGIREIESIIDRLRHPWITAFISPELKGALGTLHSAMEEAKEIAEQEEAQTQPLPDNTFHGVDEPCDYADITNPE